MKRRNPQAPNCFTLRVAMGRVTRSNATGRITCQCETAAQAVDAGYAVGSN